MTPPHQFFGIRPFMGESDAKIGGGYVTQSDVANHARVSLSTVSRVIRGLPVGPGLRLRVANAIERVGYRQHPTWGRGQVQR